MFIGGENNYYNHSNVWLGEDDIDRPVMNKMKTGKIPTPRNG